MKMGMTAYLGPLRDERAKLEYVNFYAHLHRVIDEQLGRVLTALGDPSDPDSIRSRTMIFRCADHGEMGLSHGGLRQTAFNAYEETINIPLVVSNPVLFPSPKESDALVSLVDVLPTVASVAGTSLNGQAKGRDLAPLIAGKAAPENDRLRRTAVDLGPIVTHPAPSESIQDEIHFTYDDHQAATALQDVPASQSHPAVRTADASSPSISIPMGRKRRSTRCTTSIGPRREPQPGRPRHG
jgi:arylsulfatase A-like enzyme